LNVFTALRMIYFKVLFAFLLFARKLIIFFHQQVVYKILNTKHTASTNMYSLTFRVRVILS